MTKFNEEQNKIIFNFPQKTYTVLLTVISIVFLLVGIPFLIAGIINISNEIPKEKFTLLNMTPQTASFLLFGIMFTIIPFIIIISTKANKNKNMSPVSFVFDNLTKEFIITETDNSSFKIPYSFITNIDTRNYVVRSNKSSITYHVVYILKNDGAFIDLFQTTDKNKTEEIKNILKTKIDLSKSDQSIDNPVPELPQKIKCVEENGKSFFQWENNYSLIAILSAFILLFIFFYLIIQIARREITPLIIISIFAVLFESIVIYGIIKTLYLKFNYIVMFVDNEFITYGYMSKKSGVFKEKTRIPLNVINRIQYCYDFQTEVYGLEKRLIAVQEGVKTLEETKLNGTAGIAELIATARENSKNLTISITGLKLTEMLKFEKVLESKINQFGGKVI